ncbi:ssDNA endonuclease and repair protein rad10 [Geranomyces michiganensis]|nr:ssDNA endonuclease and repair protein rad10 [Geranomyces michiganensis]
MASPRKGGLFKVPTADEVAKRQRDLRDKVSLNKFAPASTHSTTSAAAAASCNTPPRPSLPAATAAAGVSAASSSKSITDSSAGPSRFPAPPHSTRFQTAAGPSGTAQFYSAGAGPSALAQPNVLAPRGTTPIVTVARGARPQAQPPPAAHSANPLLANDPPRRAGASRTGNSIIVNSCQRGNGILKYIRNVPWEYGPIVPDYQIGETACALFLSLKYHRLHPDYVYTRIKQLGQSFLVRVLLCVVDIDDHQSSIRDLTRIAVYNNFTIILAWSAEEAGRYLETFKAYEHKPPDILKERVDPDYLAKLTDAITQIKSINKTDVITLASAFGSLKNIIAASPDDLEQCPGFGKEKVRRLHEAFNEPFLLNKKRRA